MQLLLATYKIWYNTKIAFPVAATKWCIQTVHTICCQLSWLCRLFCWKLITLPVLNRQLNKLVVTHSNLSLCQQCRILVQLIEIIYIMLCCMCLNTKSSTYPDSPHFQAHHSYILTQTSLYMTFFSCKSYLKIFSNQVPFVLNLYSSHIKQFLYLLYFINFES